MHNRAPTAVLKTLKIVFEYTNLEKFSEIKVPLKRYVKTIIAEI